MEPRELTVTEAAAEIRAGTLSCRELVASCLAAIDARDGDVRAWVRLRADEAVAEAGAADAVPREELADRPLLGIPIGIKDIFETAGVETSAGSPVLAGNVPQRDADVVRRLRAAGAIVLGKTATTPFAWSDPPVTRNPHDLACTPGGSSAGSAAAVAAHMCLAALGTQTAGSILRPAAYCGAVGFKPTYGAVSRRGVIPLAWSLDHVGPITRSVADAHALFARLAAGAPAPGPAPGGRYVVGIPDRYFDDASPAVTVAYARALDAVRDLDCRPRTVELPPSFEAAVDAGEVVLAAEAAAFHEQWFDDRRDDYGPALAALVERGRAVPATAYVHAQRIRRQAANELRRTFEQVDVLLTPATPTVAPRDLSTTGDPRYNRPFSTLGLPALGVPVPGSGPLPAAVQVVAGHARDAQVLAFGSRLETALAGA
jgi:aspartyl-tRNA(Asn)/glutamyl-tRNA(Gln) amidotransferase subunit A